MKYKTIKAKLDVVVQTRSGMWLPAIPVPFFLALRVQCECGKRFWREKNYRAHYMYVHVYDYD